MNQCMNASVTEENIILCSIILYALAIHETEQPNLLTTFLKCALENYYKSPLTSKSLDILNSYFKKSI